MADRIAVIGAGQMGNGIAHVFAQSGFDVTMIDVAEAALAKGRETIASNLDRQIKKGTLPEAERSPILAPLSSSTSTDALAGPGLVTEASARNPKPRVPHFAD